MRCLALFALLVYSALTFCAEPSIQEADPTKQTDADWMDDRWQKTDLGRFLGATYDTPGRKTPKGIAIQVGDNNEGAVCFDTDLMRYSAGWTGGFVQMHAQRYGLIVAPKPAGEIQFITKPTPGWARDGSFADPRALKLGPLPKDWAHYRGLHRHGKRVVLSYTFAATAALESPWLESSGSETAFTRTFQIDPLAAQQTVKLADADGSGSVTTIAGVKIALNKSGSLVTAVAVRGPGDLQIIGSSLNVVLPQSGSAILSKAFIWRGEEEDLEKFVGIVRRSADAEPLTAWTKGGPSLWGEPILTRGAVDKSAGPLAIDNIAIPFENKWNALFFVGGHDFFANGDAAVATIHGDVWRVSGLDATLERVQWKRFATGLYQPLGVKIINDRVHVMERDQITILHDLNNDGEADFHQNFNNDCISAGGGHSYATSLETDSKGNFYFTKCAEGTPHGGSLLRVSADGSKLDVIATGFRNPNGLGMGPRDEITVADQQGDWVPETRLDLITPGGFYGFMPMHHRATPPTDYDRPLLWVPRALDNSAGGQVWVPGGKWGLLSGKMLHLSYGRCTMMMVLPDSSRATQGAVVALPGRFLSGVMRARFSPHDGHLYLSGLRGWQTAAIRDGCFQRVRYTGASLNIPTAFATKTNGIELTFATALDSATAADPGSYGLEQWNYKWSSQYGSPDYSVADASKQKRDDVSIESARLSADRKTIFIQAPIQPAMQLRLRYNLDDASGKMLRNDFYATIHELPR